MKPLALLPLFTALLLLSGAGAARAGDNDTDAAVKKPVVRRATPESVATTAIPTVRRDSRPPAAPAFIEVRVAHTRPAAPWSPGAPGD